ncbi:hypothetical protein L596_014205 [Steinernema carpocapsae]|uniref:Uncharacterized protein n=1 Tax=Steinernema carpocapsae TaxID=34508 RepID=A0A4V6A2Q8_STECR|nr:hypothetical protein L596_014205 [Steinernema carpocapsae]
MFKKPIPFPSFTLHNNIFNNSIYLSNRDINPIVIRIVQKLLVVSLSVELPVLDYLRHSVVNEPLRSVHDQNIARSQVEGVHWVVKVGPSGKVNRRLTKTERDERTGEIAF